MGQVNGSPREALAELLGGTTAQEEFSTQEELPADQLRIEVDGIGPLGFPLPDEQAAQLTAIARPARYGQGEQTLLDRTIRDTGEVPLDLVRIDQQAWDAALVPALGRLGRALGVPEGRGLRAELHSVLVYGPGQFFAPHQDSEKADDMVGTLVVGLPSEHTGGSLVVEHAGQSAIHDFSWTALTLVALYADCRHEVRPIRSGHRVTLTYNLLLTGSPADTTDSVVVADVARALDRHFTSPAEQPSWQRSRDDEPPRRLVYLLDHEYTPRSLSWSRLKGDDAARAATLRAAAERADCEVILALADVHETWNCDEPEWRQPWNHRSGWSRYDSHEDDDDDGDEDEGDDGYVVDDLIDSEVTLEHWVDGSGTNVAPILTEVGAHELCQSTPSSALRPYSSEYEGYMGNYGNTLDRWYHRGALVVWPRRLAFAVRTEADPLSALDALLAERTDRDPTAAREKAAMIVPFWDKVARLDLPPVTVDRILRAADVVDDPTLAAELVGPLRIEHLAPLHAGSLAALTDRYGQDWTGERIAAWSHRNRRSWGGASNPERADWVADLGLLTDALTAAGAAGAAGSAGGVTAGLLVRAAWTWLEDQLEGRSRHRSPRALTEALNGLGPSTAAVLTTSGTVPEPEVNAAVVATLCAGGEDLLPCLTSTIRAAAALDPTVRAGAGFDTVARRCVAQIEQRLTLPERAEGDWSIGLPPGWHDCPLCDELSSFLADPARRVFEWKIAEPKRAHVHQTIDATELPVEHVTRRTGSPYTLVLTKTDALFQDERQRRRQDEVDLTTARALLHCDI